MYERILRGSLYCCWLRFTVSSESSRYPAIPYAHPKVTSLFRYCSALSPHTACHLSLTLTLTLTLPLTLTLTL